LPSDGQLDLDRIRIGIAEVFGFVKDLVHSVEVVERCTYSMNGCTFWDPFLKFALYSGPGNAILSFRDVEGWVLEPRDGVLLVRASIFTPPMDRIESLQRTCLDMQGGVCDDYAFGRTCDSTGEELPTWAPDIIRQRIVEQECYACSILVETTKGQRMQLSFSLMPRYREWGMAQRRMDELSAATGVEIGWASFATVRDSTDWTPSTIAAYLLWLTPAIVSIAVPLGFALLRACQPKGAVWAKC
jgi:hypothetical protein